jgi:chromosome segregation protein
VRICGLFFSCLRLLAEVQALLEAGKPAGEKLSLLEAALKEAEANLRAEKKARLIQLEAGLRALPLPEAAKASLEAAFALAEETLREGGLPGLKPLEGELARLEAEARCQEEEREALARELAAKGEASAPLLEELRAVPLEALPQRLPEIKARYAALLMTQGEEAALKAKLKEAEEELKALRPEALALGLWESLEKAEEALAKGELPDLAALRREVAQARETARREALEELSRMEALAERFLGFGGEGVLRLIAEEKAKPLPDPTPVARAPQALKRRLEAKREEVLTRLTALFQAYGGLEGFQNETHRRLRPLLQFLQSAKESLPRLGPKGLAQVEKTLAEAESLLEELKREAEAAKSILKEIQGADLEALLGVFEEKPPLDLDRFRLPGVEALGFLEESPPLPKEALQELKRALEPLRGLFQEEGPVALLLGQKALVLAPFSGRTLVALMEPGALSAFLLELSS